MANKVLSVRLKPEVWAKLDSISCDKNRAVVVAECIELAFAVKFAIVYTHEAGKQLVRGIESDKKELVCNE